MALFLAKSPIVEKYDLSSIKMCLSAAAPLPVDLVGAVWKRLNIPIKQGYGLSETSPGAHFQVGLHQKYNPTFANSSVFRVAKTGKRRPALLANSYLINL